MTRIYFLILTLFIPLYCETESYLEEKWNWEGFRIFDYHFQPELSSADLGDSISGTSRVNVSDFYALIPIKPENSFFVQFGGWHRAVHNKVFVPTTLNIDHTSNSLRALFCTVYKFPEKHYLYGEYQIGLDGKWDSPSVDDINIRTILFWGFVPKKDRHIRVGLIYDRIFGIHRPVPLVGVSFSFGERSAFDFLFPSHMLYRVRVSPRFETGIRSEINSGSWGVKDHKERGLIHSYLQGGASLYGEVKLIHIPEKSISIRARLEGGMFFLNTTTITDEDNNELFKEKKDPTPMINFSIRWSV